MLHDGYRALLVRPFAQLGYEAVEGGRVFCGKKWWMVGGVRGLCWEGAYVVLKEEGGGVWSLKSMCCANHCLRLYSLSFLHSVQQSYASPFLVSKVGA